MKRLFLFAIALLYTGILLSQEVKYARKMLNKLASDNFYGRGYVKRGNEKAAAFIKKQLEKTGAESFDGGYFQKFYYPMNTFPGKLSVKTGDKKLVPGEDFVVSCSSPSVKGDFSLLYLSDTAKSVKTLLTFIAEQENPNYFLVVPSSFNKIYGIDIPYVKGVVLLSEKQPYWHVSNGSQVKKTVWLKIKSDLLKNKPPAINIEIENRFIEKFQTQNIAAYVKGTVAQDTFIVFTAHYDHLGMLGKKAIYHGANDNASGTSMVLDLARYYSEPKNRLPYSVAFIFFSGEEAGLKGSEYYAGNPLFPLNSIKLLVNLDMVGSGSDGITVVNGKIYKDLFNGLTELNNKNHYLKKIKNRGEACNSDHCPFYKKGVKSIFIYTMGKELTAYHVPEDNATGFPFTAYEGLFRLLTTYMKTLKN